MANTTILQKKSSNTTILQEQVEPPCHAKTIVHIAEKPHPTV